MSATPRGTGPGVHLPTSFWRWSASASALEAAIVLALHLSAAFIIAGVLACGSAAIAYREGQLRRQGHASDLGSLLVTVLAVSSIMMLILAVAGYGRRLTPLWHRHYPGNCRHRFLPADRAGVVTHGLTRGVLVYLYT